MTLDGLSEQPEDAHRPLEGVLAGTPDPSAALAREPASEGTPGGAAEDPPAPPEPAGLPPAASGVPDEGAEAAPEAPAGAPDAAAGAPASLPAAADGALLDGRPPEDPGLGREAPALPEPAAAAEAAGDPSPAAPSAPKSGGLTPAAEAAEAVLRPPPQPAEGAATATAPLPAAEPAAGAGEPEMATSAGVFAAPAAATGARPAQTSRRRSDGGTSRAGSEFSTQTLAANGGQLWRVVGGEDKGGLLVRAGFGIGSAVQGSRQAGPKRLATGAIVKKLEYRDNRLKFLRIKGDGPETGWVTVHSKTKDKALLEPHQEPRGPAPAEAAEAAVTAPEGEEEEGPPG
eukprot:CAMPEP_0168395616 /NCGR_PEP_ID=MMETSP0228-20121227/20138_1 /TAXON_ID=133427 /ORGANISM="Protoceratium reticulatum, Strain CCCM 535 (=CCMP 1889)" /LENGTH=343 /DNA_ID=CAMNT_0008409059 /DNA_START=69 /DNA_END=1096 /DNA_ORIENTATION=-